MSQVSCVKEHHSVIGQGLAKSQGGGEVSKLLFSKGAGRAEELFTRTAEGVKFPAAGVRRRYFRHIPGFFDQMFTECVRRNIPHFDKLTYMLRHWLSLFLWASTGLRIPKLRVGHL